MALRRKEQTTLTTASSAKTSTSQPATVAVVKPENDKFYLSSPVVIVSSINSSGINSGINSNLNTLHSGPADSKDWPKLRNLTNLFHTCTLWFLRSLILNLMSKNCKFKMADIM